MWFKVDDRLHSHQKALAAGLEALGLWVKAASWCMAHQTDGRITECTLRYLCIASTNTQRARKAKRLAEKLVGSGLFISLANGTEFQFKNWDEYQPSVQEWKELQNRRAKAGALGGQARARSNSQQAPNVRLPVPSRPGPTPERAGTKTETTSRGSPPLGAAGEPAARPEERQSQPQSGAPWRPSPAFFDQMTRRWGSSSAKSVNEFLKVNAERLDDPHLDWEDACETYVRARSDRAQRRPDEKPRTIYDGTGPAHEMSLEQRKAISLAALASVGLATSQQVEAAEREALSGGAGLNGASHASVEEVFDRKDGTNDV